MPPRIRQATRRLDAAGLAKAPPPASGSTPGRRWRFRRNLVIYVAHRQGLSQRLLAEVFNLPRSRIAEILAEFRQYEDEGRSRDVGDDREAVSHPPT